MSEFSSYIIYPLYFLYRGCYSPILRSPISHILVTPLWPILCISHIHNIPLSRSKNAILISCWIPCALHAGKIEIFWCPALQMAAPIAFFRGPPITATIIVKSRWNTLPLSPNPMLDDTINARIYLIFPTTREGTTICTPSST